MAEAAREFPPVNDGYGEIGDDKNIEVTDPDESRGLTKDDIAEVGVFVEESAKAAKAKAEKEAKEDAEAIWGAAKKLDEEKKLQAQIAETRRKADERDAKRAEAYRKRHEKEAAEGKMLEKIEEEIEKDTEHIERERQTRLTKEAKEDAEAIWGAAKKLDEETDETRAKEDAEAIWGAAKKLDEEKKLQAQIAETRRKADERDAKRAEADWKMREKEAAEILGEEGMKEIEAETEHAEREREAGIILERDQELKEHMKREIADIEETKTREAGPTVIVEQGDSKVAAKLPEGEDRELRAELNVQTEEAALLEKEWKAAREKLEAMKIDADRPRGMFGRLSLGFKKLFNRDLRQAHDEFETKQKAWKKAEDRIEELKAALDVDEGPGAKLRHRGKSGGSGQAPTGKASIRGEM